MIVKRSELDKIVEEETRKRFVKDLNWIYKISIKPF